MENFYRFLVLVLVAVILLQIAAFSENMAGDDADSDSFRQGRSTYLWNTTSLITSLNEKSSLRFRIKTQYLASEDTRESTFLECSASRTMNSWLRLGLGFRAVQTPKETGDVYEYRPQLITTVYNSKYPVKYSSINRLEHRSFNKGESHFRYYHNISVDFPAFAPKVPKLFLIEELFTKLNEESLHLIRVYGGLHIYERSHFVVDLFYVWQQTKTGGKWSGSDVFGLDLTFKI
jgi:hypothetical protein